MHAPRCMRHHTSRNFGRNKKTPIELECKYLAIRLKIQLGGFTVHTTVEAHKRERKKKRQKTEEMVDEPQQVAAVRLEAQFKDQKAQ